MLSNKLFSSIGNTDRLYVDDVFSAYTYTGNGSTQTINNGIDLAGKGGLVWGKSRSGTWGAIHHKLVDTARGTDNILTTSTTSPNSASSQTLTAFSSSGFSLGTSAELNGTGTNYVSWTFRRAPRFFDVVTYTGNGAGSRSIAHSLGVAPGMVIVKCTSFSGTEWQVWHRSLSSTHGLILNNTDASSVGRWPSTSHDASSFYVNAAGDLNSNGQSYVAYLFAHDPTADGIVQCGSYVANGSASGPIINLGWEPQYVMIKRAVGGTGNWILLDSMRGMTVVGNDATLCANSSGAENGVLLGNWVSPTATGFQITESSPEVNGSASDTYIYLAIRRPNKPPTTGTEVYNAIARTGTGTAATVTGVGFAPDLVHSKFRTDSTTAHTWFDRLRGATQMLSSNTTGGESATTCLTSFGMDGLVVGADSFGYINYSGGSIAHHFFRRAPGFMDVVCYTGTGAASQLITHSLAVSPELVIIKRRNGADSWMVYTSSQAQLAILNQTNNFGYNPAGRFSGVSASTFTISSDSGFGANGGTYVAYLFASLPGISKVGSYTGNGSSQTINCGFSTGARFILIKRTDSTGDWYVWDTARGIIAANDPHLSLNTTSAEDTTNDSVDPNSTGFIVNQVAATNINVNGATYIFLSIA